MDQLEQIMKAYVAWTMEHTFFFFNKKEGIMRIMKMMRGIVEWLPQWFLILAKRATKPYGASESKSWFGNAREMEEDWLAMAFRAAASNKDGRLIVLVFCVLCFMAMVTMRCRGVQGPGWARPEPDLIFWPSHFLESRPDPIITRKIAGSTRYLHNICKFEHYTW